ncbi:MAG: Mov34/MPN/PAD-1 family protein [Methanobacteriota archaeon]
MAIYISESGFITLTLSAIETSTEYEACGILLGYKVKHKRKTIYYVENVIPYQIAKRAPDSIRPIRRKRIRKIFPKYMKYKIIGEFHTHPEGSVSLSKPDKDFIRSSNYQLEVVVAIRLSNETHRWSYKRKILSGSIDKYLIEIAGWKVCDKKIIEQIIRCPFAVGFDYSEPFE